MFRIISGGQTGADQAALDVALELGVVCGGWVPKGRTCESGLIPPKYPYLMETDSEEVIVRTTLNVRDSDATVIFSNGPLQQGSLDTFNEANKQNKPCLHIDFSALDAEKAEAVLSDFLNENSFFVLNVAGPRESDDPEIYEQVRNVLLSVISQSVCCDSLKNGEDEKDINVAISLRDAALADYRHWDSIRWQVPYWYCTLATGAATLATLSANPALEPLVRGVSTALAFFGAFSLGLLCNLIRYDNKVTSDFNGLIKRMRISDYTRSLMQISRPFALKSKGLLSTATFYFLLYQIVIVGFFVATAVCGMWWLPYTL